MREILFRAWHKKRKKHYEVKHLFKDNEGNLWADCIGDNIISHQDVNVRIQPEDCIIEQYTGLKDKNGVNNLFEGDNVTARLRETREEVCGLIIFDNGEYLVEQDNDKFPLCAVAILEDFEITGNIHDTESIEEG